MKFPVHVIIQYVDIMANSVHNLPIRVTEKVPAFEPAFVRVPLFAAAVTEAVLARVEFFAGKAYLSRPVF